MGEDCSDVAEVFVGSSSGIVPYDSSSMIGESPIYRDL